MRIFVALDIDPAIRQRIAGFMLTLRNQAPECKWVSPESLHVTLKFIGEQPPERVEEIRHALAAVRARPFPVAFRNFGFFPSAKSPRIFWLGVEAGEDLPQLAGSIEAVTAKFGVKSEIKYTPHLTLARERTRETKERRGKLADMLNAMAHLPVPEFGTMAAREFFLFESRLSPKGAEYTRIATYGLC
jgi:2'-5' RNA ligase